MSAISIKVDLGDAQKAVDRALAKVSNLRPAFLAVGEALVESTQDRFVSEKGPDGASWTALSPRYLKSKAKAKSRHPKGILKKSGQLAENIHAEATATSVTISSPEVYSAIHQFGGTTGSGGKMPARPFLGVSDGDLRTIKSVFEDHLSGE